MKKVYYLSTCSTCTKIIKELRLKEEGFEFQDIKTEKITSDQLQAMAKVSGSYESLFSRKALKFRAMGLDKKQLTEKDYKELILQEYTFLKRPVVVIKNQVFVGNSKNVIDAIAVAIG